MSFTARDGKSFPDTIRLRRYEGFLDSKAAPGGEAQAAAMKEHGAPSKITIERLPMGRHRISAEHPDGHHSTMVQGSVEAAHNVIGDFMGVNPPMGGDFHRNAAAHPTGEAEQRRLAHEDRRDLPPPEETT
ncbi:MAG: hypothetical protein ACRD2E_08875 [Terriglobales bacterium]